MFPFGIRDINQQKNKEYSYEIRVNDVSDRIFLDMRDRTLDKSISKLTINKN